jgi:hypothetical protein
LSTAVRCVAITAVLGTLFFAASAHASTASTAGAASMSFDPSSYDFGTKVPGTGPSPPKAFTLTNTGEFSLSVNYAAIAWAPQEYGDPEVFTITSNDCGTLVPGASCTIEVVFNPFLPGPKWGTLSVAAPFSEYCDPRHETCQPGNISAQARMTGTARTISLSPASLTFLPLEAGTRPSPPRTVTVTNEGELDVKIFNVMLANYQHSNANQFRIVGGSCGANVVLTPQGTCTVEVAFSPSTPGGLSADLGILDNAAGGEQFAPLEGEGVAPLLQSQPPPVQVFLFGRPAKLTAKRGAVFWFKGTETAVAFECKLDSHPFAPCASPARFKHLRVGPHYFAVRALDGNRNTSPDAAARYQWRIKTQR